MKVTLIKRNKTLKSLEQLNGSLNFKIKITFYVDQIFLARPIDHMIYKIKYIMLSQNI